MAMRDTVLLFVNGRRCDVAGESVFLTLSDWLRVERRLTGTKVVCAEGDCGACTVLLGRPEGDRPWRFEPVNACILGMAQLDGAHVITVEAVADGERPHAVQDALRTHHGSQCGFCTPGFVMALLGHFEHRRDACSARDAKNHTTGNLCRCTGYQPIVDAAQAVAPESVVPVVPRYHNADVAAALEAARAQPFSVSANARWGDDGGAPLGRIDAPTTLEALLALRAEHPGARLVSGNTDLGVVVNKGYLWPPGQPRHVLITSKVAELGGARWEGNTCRVGATATLAELERATAERVPELSRLLRVFASPQIKAVATLIGNVANGSPIGDTLPALLALDAQVEVASVRGQRVIPIGALYTGYRQLALAPDELIVAVRFDAPGGVFSANKVCQRKDLDISFVGAAYRVSLDAAGVVTDARIAYGGVGPTAARLPDVEARLVGQRLADSAEPIAAAIEASIAPRSDVRGSAEGRRLLAGNLYRRFVLESCP